MLKTNLTAQRCSWYSFAGCFPSLLLNQVMVVCYSFASLSDVRSLGILIQPTLHPRGMSQAGAERNPRKGGVPVGCSMNPLPEWSYASLCKIQFFLSASASQPQPPACTKPQPSLCSSGSLSCPSSLLLLVSPGPPVVRGH